jgi:hypothetical protein
MSVSNLYFKGCFEELSQEQKDALGEVSGVETDLVDKSCDRELNTCGAGIDEIFDLYPIYDPQRGLFNTWGGIPFPWKISDLTFNLDFPATDDKWRVASYKARNAYFIGDRVIVIENDGYKICVYEALEDIPALSKAFKREKWEEVCCIETTIPAGLPSIEELKERFSYYFLDFFYRDWQDFISDWSNDLEEPEGNDQWNNARIRKEFFYREGDIVLVDSECEDALCVYIAIKDMPATQGVYDEYVKFKTDEYWQKIYCVKTGYNKCLEYQRKNQLSNYEVIPIGSQGHFVERPIPYDLAPPAPTLDQMADLGMVPVVLTQEQIDALEGGS